ncbi:GntR family transcriptional regulator [Kiloniella spongiae]|uniref:GntR family transcriptional regulator n=1 Tax=Kiloniella spongiae TaxID=1489064 RepID=A0A0H2MUH1_9PROT|nr:GntR family transcriptional regulator [Kiloniella spongiae]KLN60360.1 GntR family transcriptional regulator [Kiloniella spongiae]
MSNSLSQSLKIERPPVTLREMALERMRAAIIAGQFPSGTRLVERPLCEQLGVSRSVVRETIRYLEAEGLVEIIPNKGPIVALMDWDQAKQIYDVRLLLEAKAAETCASVATKKDKARLKKALDALEAAYHAGEVIQLFETTTDFYKVIFEISGHRVAWEIVQRLNGRISRLRAMTLGTFDRHQTGFSRITEIYQAIADNDPDTASKSVQVHLNEASEIARKLLTNENDGKGNS